MNGISFKFFYVDLANDEDLIKWCMDVGLIASRSVCSKCGGEMKVMKKNNCDGYMWRCHKPGENKHDVGKSIREGTWFANSKLTMRTILVLTYMWCLKLEHAYIMADLNLSNQTVTEWTSFCRDVCVGVMKNGREKIGGPGAVVEIGKIKFERRKRFDGKLVIGGSERGSSKCFMRVVTEVNSTVLLQTIKDYILEGSTVVSDLWKAYDCLEDEGYAHLNYSFEDPTDTGTRTNSIDSTWTAIKRNLERNVTEKDLDGYLMEYIWRRQSSKKNIMAQFIEAIKLIYRPPTFPPAVDWKLYNKCK